MAQFKRRKKLIKPGLQLQLSLTFVGLSILGLMMQSILFMRELSEIASALPNDGLRLGGMMSDSLSRVFLITSFVFVPLVLIIGVLTTFRLAGPVFRMERHLRELREGKYTGPCRIRKGDKFGELCDEINATVEHLVARLPEEERGKLGAAADGTASADHQPRSAA
ncbi:MAG: hypothetical protein H6828_03170 [Planctomycetes bacterium]|nr:hypothetical protein [Planctomycetota bacterium]